MPKRTRWVPYAYAPWNLIRDKVDALLLDIELASMQPGQYWIWVGPKGKVSIGSTFSGDNSYIPGDDRIKLLRRDIRGSGVYGPFEFESDPKGTILVSEEWDWPKWFNSEKELLDFKEVGGGVRVRISGLTDEGRDELLSIAEGEYNEALKNITGRRWVVEILGDYGEWHPIDGEYDTPSPDYGGTEESVIEEERSAARSAGIEYTQPMRAIWK